MILESRLLRRVPIDFYYPPNLVWCGYSSEYLRYCPQRRQNKCDECRRRAEDRGIPIFSTPEGLIGCPLFHEYYGVPQNPPQNMEPPIGEGYQLWEYTSEGSPQSPVFSSFHELCAWCEKNATIYADIKAPQERWKEIFKKAILLVEAGGMTLSLPMDDERLYYMDPENEFHLFSLQKSAQCRYAGLLTEKLPTVVSVKEMNMLAFVIQQFDEAEEDIFMHRVSDIPHVLPGELLNIALGICPEAAGFEKGSGVQPVYSGENLHEIMGYKNFIDQLNRYPHMQILKFYFPIKITHTSESCFSTEPDGKTAAQYQNELSSVLAGYSRYQDVDSEEEIYFSYLKGKSNLLFEYLDAEIKNGKLYGVVTVGTGQSLSREEILYLGNNIRILIYALRPEITDNSGAVISFRFLGPDTDKPDIIDTSKLAPRKIFELLSSCYKEWLLNTTGFIPDFRTDSEFSQISSCWITVSYNRRTLRVPLPTDEKKIASALFQIGAPLMSKAVFSLFMPEVPALNNRMLPVIDTTELNLMADLLQKKQADKKIELNEYFLANQIPVQKGIETVIKILQADEPGPSLSAEK